MAKKNIDEFFLKKRDNDYIANDHKIKANILAKTGGSHDEIYDNYIAGAALDTVISSKLDFLKSAQVFFNENKVYDKEAAIIEQIFLYKAKPLFLDYFELIVAHYRSGRNERSREVAQNLIQKYPQQISGYEWSFNNARILDSVRKDSIAVPDALRLHEFSSTDTAKYKKQYLLTVRYLAPYYINDARDREKALIYFRKWLAADPANATVIQGYIDQIERAAPKPGSTPQPPTRPAGGNPPRSAPLKP